ncbi:MAG TPA: LysR family transcriptional regulator [Verrucomicrobiota bacterium]|nr:LysR family transcriptional regulator [Verrucomicrobiota bacterium]
MQIESFKVFRDLAETESFTKAAQINGVTQSAVSQQVSSMERQFRTMLIERSKKRFRLTREGELLYQTAKSMVQLYETFEAQMQELRDVVSGTLRVGTIYSLGLYNLPPYLRKFMRAHPGVHVHVAYMRSNTVYEEVAGNALDLGLVAYPVKDPQVDLVPIGRDRLVLITPPAHPRAREVSLAVKALDGEKFISFEPDIPTRRAIDRAFTAAHVHVQHVMEVDNIETVKRAVEIGLGVSIVPQSTVLREVEQGALSQVELEGGDFVRPLAAIIKKGKVQSPAMKQFLQTLREPLNAAEPAVAPAKPARRANGATAVRP